MDLIKEKNKYRKVSEKSIQNKIEKVPTFFKEKLNIYNFEEILNYLIKNEKEVYPYQSRKPLPLSIA